MLPSERLAAVAKRKTFPYPPPWQDRDTLAWHLSTAPATLEHWVTSGIIPAPVKRGAKLMWEWAAVDDWMRNGAQNAAGKQGSIADAVKREREADSHASY